MNTRFLASVTNLYEASALLAAGVDIIDIKDPHKGALGAVEAGTICDIVQNVAGQVTTSATIGDLPLDPDHISCAVDNMQNTGVDIIKIGIFSDLVPANILQIIKKHTNDGCRIVLVYFADLKPRLDDFSILKDAGVYGVMLDTADKTKGSLRTFINDDILKNFIIQAKSSGLLTGLAGSLKLADIQPLLKLNPDYLGFRGALCNKHQRINTIDMQSVYNVRAMIPNERVNNGDIERLTVMV